MAAKNGSSNGSTEEETNDITLAHQMKADLNDLAHTWKQQIQEAGGQMASKVSGSKGPSGNFHRGFWDGEGSVEIGTTFTIPMDAPAWMIEQMKADFDQMGAEVEIDVSASVTGRPPKVKESGVVVPQGPSPEQIDAMDESDKTHTGVVEVTLDVTDQMVGVPVDMIIEGAKVSHPRYGISRVTGLYGSDPEEVYIEPEDQDQMKGTVASVDLEDLALIRQNLGDA